MAKAVRHAVKILGRPWEIRVSRRLTACWGYADYERSRIVISGSARHRERRDTVLHEVLHACLPMFCEEAIEEMARALDASLDAAEDAGIL